MSSSQSSNLKKSPNQRGKLMEGQETKANTLDGLLHPIEITKNDDDNHKIKNRKSGISTKV